MISRNFLLIFPNCIKLEGFYGISDRITFCFYKNGTVISPNELENRPYRYTVEVQNNKIFDKNLINFLKNKRLYNECVEFIKTSDSYIESEPKRELIH